jgi:protein-tyrosine-phosphatase
MKTVLFVCGHNAGRSQMAEAILNHAAAERGVDVRATSAGTTPAGALNPAVVSAMEEIGVPVSGQHPKLLTGEMADAADRIITMGCSVSVESCPARVYVCEDWHLDDPAGQSIERVRAIRDQIKEKVEDLLAEWG